MVRLGCYEGRTGGTGLRVHRRGGTRGKGQLGSTLKRGRSGIS
jgi:hypothetical protein